MTKSQRKSGDQTRKKFLKHTIFDKKLKSIQLDPMLETADIDTTNNLWTADKVTQKATSKFQVFKQNQENRRRGAAAGMVNPMQAAGKKN